MKVNEILTLPYSQQLLLLKNNCNDLDVCDIEKNLKFYDNEHKIKFDCEKDDYWEQFDVMKEDGTVVKEPHKVEVTKMAIPYQTQIVNNATAFVFGNKLDLILNGDRQKQQNKDSFETFKKIWDNDLKMMTMLRKVFRATCIETRSALNFFIDSDGKVRVKLLSYKEGYSIYRHKDDDGKLDAVVVEYKTDKIINGRLYRGVKITEIWTAEKMIRYTNDKNPIEKPNPSNKLLFGFFEQDNSEFDLVKDIINAQDYGRSMHSDVNKRIGNPPMVVFGKIESKPLLSRAAPIYEINSGNEFDATKTSTGMMNYLELKSAPESVKLEFENNENDIFRFTWPDLSKLMSKSFGDLSTKSMRVLLTSAFVKMAEKQEIYDDMIARCISIIKTLAVIVTGDQNIADLDISFKYNSILPDSDADMVTMLATAVGSNITSREQAVRLLPFNTPDTLREIEEEGLKEEATVQDETETPNPDGINGN